MLSPDLVYKISTFLSPKALIKLSLCSRNFRTIILSDQRIWRAQYYNEWPAFFTPHSPKEDVLFPAPTWIQVFFMRKLSELNIERNRFRKDPNKFDNQFFQDLTLHYDFGEKTKLTLYKNAEQKVAEFGEVHDFNPEDIMSQCGKNLIVGSYSGTGQLSCFSMTGKYARIDSEFFRSIFAIDANHFIGMHHDGAAIYTISDEHIIQSQKLDFSNDCILAQIYGKPGHFISVEKDTESKKSFTWRLWKTDGTLPEQIMERTFTLETEVYPKNFILADTDFVFIPYDNPDHLFVYVYSFKEDKSRTFKIQSRKYRSTDAAIFYASDWNSMNSRRIYFYGNTTWVCFSGTTLDSLKFTYDEYDVKQIKFVQISRKLLFIASHEYDDTCEVIDMLTGSVIKRWEIDCKPYEADVNSRYLLCGKKLYNFSPKKLPKIKEWLHQLFK